TATADDLKEHPGDVIFCSRPGRRVPLPTSIHPEVSGVRLSVRGNYPDTVGMRYVRHQTRCLRAVTAQVVTPADDFFAPDKAEKPDDVNRPATVQGCKAHRGLLPPPPSTRHRCSSRAGR